MLVQFNQIEVYATGGFHAELVLLQISFFTSSITSLPHLVTLLSRKILAILQYCCGFPPSEACQSGATLRAIREKTYLAKH